MFHLLFEALVLLLSILFNAFVLVLLALPLLPVHHDSQFLLLPLGPLSLVPADLLEDVSLGFSDQLLFQLDLVFLLAHPFFMGDRIHGAFADLAALHALAS